MLLIRSYIIAFPNTLPTRTQAGAFRLLLESHPPPHERQPPSADRRLRREKSPKLHLRTLLPCSLHFLSCRTSGGHHTRGDSSKMMWIRFLQSAASSRLLPPSFLFPLYHDTQIIHPKQSAHKIINLTESVPSCFTSDKFRCKAELPCFYSQFGKVYKSLQL